MTHPLEALAKSLERAFEAVEQPQLIDSINANPRYADITVTETLDGFKVQLLLNDINPDGVQISWSYGLLTLSSVEMEDTDERTWVEVFQAETDEANPDPERLEAYLPFNYQISLPSNVDPAVIAIEFVEDTLEIQLTKAKSPSVALAS